MKELETDTAACLAAVHEAAMAKLARDPVAVDVRKLTSMTDVIYICHGETGRAVAAIANSIIDGLRSEGHKSIQVEGLSAGRWVLIDMADIMIHIFEEERREYYSLEKLWHDGRSVALPEWAEESAP